MSIPIATYPFSITIGKVNGYDNSDPHKSASVSARVLTVVPINRPLIEEYTGLRCGNCPRGYVAMEYMKETFGDRFVGMAFHSSSYETAMATVERSDFPVQVSSYPSGDINRNPVINPSDIPSLWADYAAVLPPAEVTLDISRSPGDNTITLTSSLTFIEDSDNANYSLAYAIVGDNLHNPDWVQTNYYSDGGTDPETDIWDLFVGKGSMVSDLIFNDVVIAFNDIDGVHASVPKTVKGGETMTHSYTYNCADFKNLSGEEFINDDALLHGVVILLDKNTRLAVNSNKSASIPYLNNESSVAPSSMSEVIISTEWYTPLGLRVDGNKTSGMLIRVDRLADGTFRTSKTFGR